MARRVTGKVRRFIDWVNKRFPADSEGYDVAFVIEVDDQALITSESFGKDGENTIRVVDYYGQNRGGAGGPAWIHPDIQKEADKRGLFIDWRDCACVTVVQL